MTPKCNKYLKMIGKKYFSMNGFKFWGRLAWSILKRGNCYSWMFIFSASWGRIMPMKCYLKISCLSCLCSHFLENSWALKVLFFRSFNCHSEPWSPPIRSMLQGHTPPKSHFWKKVCCRNVPMYPTAFHSSLTNQVQIPGYETNP